MLRDPAFDQLACAYLDGTADDAAVAQLEHRLRAEPAAVSRLAFLLRLDLRLRGMARVRQGLVAAPSVRRPRIRRRTPARHLSWLAAAAAMLLVGVGWWWHHARPPIVAELAIAAGSVQVNEADAADGRPLRAGDRLATIDGTATVRWPDGSTAILQTSASASLPAPGRGFSLQLAAGEVAVAAARQDATAPLSIVTPLAAVRVMGTRFSVTAADESTTVHVTEGRVRLDRHSDGASAVIDAGFMVIARASGELIPVSMGGPAELHSDEPPIQPAAHTPPTAGRPTLPAAAGGGLALNGAVGARLDTVTVAGQPFAEALRIRAIAGDAEPVLDASVHGIVQSTVLRLAFSARVTAGSGRRISLKVARTGANARTHLSAAVDLEEGWQAFSLPFPVAGGSASTDPCRVSFNLGGGAGTVEIGGVQLFDHGPEALIHDLPLHSGITYDGGGPEAPWRRAAEERITTLRTAPLTVALGDGTGRPLGGVPVRIRQTRHAFAFGVAASTWYIAGRDPAQRDRNRAFLAARFNTVTLPNEMTWGTWNAKSPPALAEALAWLTAQRLEVRGGPVIWPDWVRLPDRMRTLEQNPDELRRACIDHVTHVVGGYGGAIRDWAVAYNPLTTAAPNRLLGEPALADWLRAARAAGASGRLVLDQDGLIGNPRSIDAIVSLATRLRAARVPLDGLGITLTCGWRPVQPEALRADLDRLAAAGGLMFTDFTSLNSDEAVQAASLRDALTIAFSHPAVDGFLLSTPTDRGHWAGNAPLLRADGTPKAGLAAYDELVLKRWRTDVAGVTDARGRFSVHGFLGEYRIEVAADPAASRDLVLTRPGATVGITLGH